MPRQRRSKPGNQAERFIEAPALEMAAEDLAQESRTALLKFLDGSIARCPITALSTWEKSIEPFADGAYIVCMLPVSRAFVRSP